MVKGNGINARSYAATATGHSVNLTGDGGVRSNVPKRARASSCRFLQCNGIDRLPDTTASAATFSEPADTSQIECLHFNCTADRRLYNRFQKCRCAHLPALRPASEATLILSASRCRWSLRPERARIAHLDYLMERSEPILHRRRRRFPVAAPGHGRRRRPASSSHPSALES